MWCAGAGTIYTNSLAKIAEHGGFNPGMQVGSNTPVLKACLPSLLCCRHLHSMSEFKNCRQLMC